MTHDTTPHDPPLKRCPKCGESKPATAKHFHRDRYEPDGLTVCCKVCRNGGPIYTVPLPEGVKVCSKCGEMKPETFEYFSRDKTCHNGLLSYCRECDALARAPKKDEIDEYQRRYREENKELLKQKQRAYHARPDKKQRRIERDRLNRAKIREYARGQMKRWREQHPDEWRARKRAEAHRRKALKLAAEGNHTPADVKRQYKAQKGKCYYCGVKVGDKFHVDHVVPLSRGGSNGPENLVIACEFCNTSKRDKLPSEWPQGNRLL